MSPVGTNNGRCSFRCDNTTRRTIYDGDQVLAELRYPNSAGEQDTGPDSANAAAIAAKADRPYTWQNHEYGAANTSDWAQNGRVLYMHAGGIDRPLGLIRMDYSHDFPEPVTIVPHASWRGTYEQATIVRPSACKYVYLPESEIVYMDSTGHRMVFYVATGQNGEELDIQQQRCIEIDFPGKAMNMRRFLRRNTVAGPVTWMGSLVLDNQDASGLMYRRNRYYDPHAGRFTQEDPIGLADGVNAYGFAEGDPVSYGDPYGLSAGCDDPKDPRCKTVKQLASEELDRWRDALVDVMLSTVKFAVDLLPTTSILEVMSGRDIDGNHLGSGGMAFAALNTIPIPEGRGAQVAERLIASDGGLRVSGTVARQLSGQRAYIPSMAILEAVRGGTRMVDPQGVPHHFMYRIAAERGYLEVLVDESKNVINHVMYTSK